MLYDLTLLSVTNVRQLVVLLCIGDSFRKKKLLFRVNSSVYVYYLYYLVYLLESKVAWERTCLVRKILLLTILDRTDTNCLTHMDLFFKFRVSQRLLEEGICSWQNRNEFENLSISAGQFYIRRKWDFKIDFFFIKEF